jgi:cytochrome c-type biogenesis protein
VAFNKFRKYIRMVEIGTGVMLMAVGIMLMFNLMGHLTMYLYQYLPVQG